LRYINRLTILFKLLLIFSVTLLNALELETINVEDRVLGIAVNEVDDELQINTETLSQKLFNSANINQINSVSNSNVISIRGNNFRSTDYYEDGIPLYKTANGFVDVSMYNDSSVLIDINSGASQSLYAPSAVGGEIILTSKKLKSGLSGYIDTSASTNDGYFSTLSSYKTDKYYLKIMLNAQKQNDYKLSDDFKSTAIQKDDKRVNSDKGQLNGYFKMGYNIDDNSDIAFKVSLLKSDFGIPVQVYDEPSIPKNSTADYMRIDNMLVYHNYIQKSVEHPLLCYHYNLSFHC